MGRYIKVLLLATVIFTASVFVNGPVSEVAAEQSGTFSGTWTASGKRQPFDFVADREVGTFMLNGNVSLKESINEVEDFWAECVGLSDSVTGGSVRCVWRSLKGEKAYSVLSGQPLKEGVKVTGEFVGGIGRLKGITGSFTFTWLSTFIDQDLGMFTGYTKDLSGSYRIP